MSNVNVMEEFSENLEKQIDLFQAVVELEKAKQVVLMENNIKELEIITAKEEEILLQINKLEKKRLHWAHFFSQVIGKRVEEITLDDLVHHHPPLRGLGTGLDEVIKDLQNLHVTNTKMLENAVNILNFTIESLTKERKSTYLNPRMKEKTEHVHSRNSSLIDKSI